MSNSKKDKENEIALQKMIVGHFIEEIPIECKKKVCYVLQGDGLWECRRNKLGKFDTLLESFDVPGLISNKEEGWALSVPLIPANILVQIVSFFRKINRLYDSEVFVQVFYDFETEEYFSVVPEQTVSGASVSYENDDYINDPKKLLVFEIHSHNTMGAFFSGTDDADEKDDRFYGVIGRVNQYFPEIKIRLSVGGRKWEVEVSDMFDLKDDKGFYAESFPPEWMENISKQQFMVRKYRSGRTIYVPINSPYKGYQMNLMDTLDDEDDDMSNFYPDKPPSEEWESFSNSEEEEGEIPIKDSWRGGKF